MQTRYDVLNADQFAYEMYIEAQLTIFLITVVYTLAGFIGSGAVSLLLWHWLHFSVIGVTLMVCGVTVFLCGLGVCAGRSRASRLHRVAEQLWCDAPLRLEVSRFSHPARNEAVAS